MERIEKLTEDQYTVHCLHCLSVTDLSMFPHRKAGKIVGFIFSCTDCLPFVGGGQIETTFIAPDKDPDMEAA